MNESDYEPSDIEDLDDNDYTDEPDDILPSTLINDICVDTLMLIAKDLRILTIGEKLAVLKLLLPKINNVGTDEIVDDDNLIIYPSGEVVAKPSEINKKQLVELIENGAWFPSQKKYLTKDENY